MNVNALLMDAVVWDGNTPVGFLHPDGGILVGGFVIPDFISIFDVSDTVRIENTGNVPFVLKIFATNVEDTLTPGESFFLGYGVTTHVRFDSQGIVRDLTKG